MNLGVRHTLASSLLRTVLLSLIVACVVGLLTEDRRRDLRLDIFDEGAHLDYALRLSEGGIPAFGDTLGTSALAAADCLSGGTEPRPCTSGERDPRAFFAAGYSYQAQQPPLGYVPYAVLAGDARSRPPDSYLADLRLGGRIWLVLTALVLAMLAHALRLNPLRAAALCALVLASPVLANAQATINNDAALGFAGAACVLVWVRARGRLGRSWLDGKALAVGAVVGYIKITCLLAPVALLFMSVLQLRRAGPLRLRALPRTPSGRQLLAAAQLGAGAGLATVSWSAIQNARATVPSAAVNEALLAFTRVDDFPFATLVTSLSTVLSLYTPYEMFAPVHQLWGTLVIGAVLLAALGHRAPRRDRGGRLAALGPEEAEGGAEAVKHLVAEEVEEGVSAHEVALGALTAAWLLAVLYPTSIYLAGQYNFPTTARYALTLLPLFGLVVVRLLPRPGVLVAGLIAPGLALLYQWHVLGA